VSQQAIALQPAARGHRTVYPGPQAALQAASHSLWRIFENARARRREQVAAFVVRFEAAHHRRPTAAELAAGVEPPFHTEGAAAAYLAGLDPSRAGSSEPSCAAGDGRSHGG